ncbi:inhibitor of nuclear factor kappa-B kinase subunit alpha [Aricia agestis]|uniref:inhibitor of nuclear factor kappa-B kinase subunit alpha n=1 Tax=Aricia agestis TaxID=91739 RepID=UPI001C2090A5|nr:inhibitor of nuclear factor kappa-B kinase subunit alpha [Aricia agestis]
MDDIIFIGDWVKDRVLGSGSFGTVVLWRHKNNEQKLAIKTCKWGDELTAKHRERWTKEVEMLQQCRHPNIVSTKELPPEFVVGLVRANPSKLPILCMEYCSGGDLRQVLNKPDSCGGLKEPQVRKILGDIGNAMSFLHKNKITHRDLKPENIVLHTPEGPDEKSGRVTYKIIDLGYAKELDSHSICASFVGTLQYLAPELFYSESYSNSVDFWSFGLLAFEIICGVRPFLPFKAPVEWMPLVKKKTHDHICIYETFHGDIEYSNCLFPENHISKPLKAHLEEWLKIALEWEPRLRGRMPGTKSSTSKVTFNIPSEEKAVPNNIVMFDQLEKMLATKIIKIFSVSTVSQLAYQISDSTTVAILKSWIAKDINIDVTDQIIVSRTYLSVPDEDAAEKYWHEDNNVMLYLYSKDRFIRENSIPIVPKAVQRCLEHHKALYNFKNSQNLYRNALYFVMTQMENYDSLINGIFARSESLKNESKQLLMKFNSVDKSLGKLLAKIETISKMIDLGKNHIENLKANSVGTNFLGGFSKIFKMYDDMIDKTTKLESAWAQLSTRLQSAARRSNESVSGDLSKFVAKYNYQAIFTTAYKTYLSHKKSDFYNDNKEKEKQCPEIVKVCYDCLKLRDRVLQELQAQVFVLKLKDLSIEFSKISDIITNANNTTDKLGQDFMTLSDEFSTCIWSTISILVSDAENMSELPYSVVNFQKKDFKLDNTPKSLYDSVQSNFSDGMLSSLVTESLNLRQTHVNLCDKLNAQKELLKKSVYDFSFLKNDS